jgi:hypothetical protein
VDPEIRGQVRHGYEAYREQVFERQKQLGIFPEDAELSPANPYVQETGADGKPWPELDVTRPWDSCPTTRSGCSREWRRCTRVSSHYPDAAEVPETAAANIRNRSYSIAVEVDVESPDAAGVLFSHGSAFGGHALYVKDCRLRYVYNFVGSQQQTIESTKEVPTGEVILGVSFVREGDAMPTTGALSLFIDDEKVGEGAITTQPGNFSLVGEGLNVG